MNNVDGITITHKVDGVPITIHTRAMQFAVANRKFVLNTNGLFEVVGDNEDYIFSDIVLLDD